MEVKRQTGKKIYKKYEKKRTSLIYKGLVQISKKQTNYLIEKWTKDMNKKFGGKNTNANKVLMFDFLIKKWNLKQHIIFHLNYSNGKN